MSSTEPATADDWTSSSTVQWSDLPDELLSMLYLGLTAASPIDRVYFAAVSRSWRSVAARHPAPPDLLPWLIFSPHRRDYNSRTKRAFRAHDGAVLPVRLPSKATGQRFVGSHDGGWVALAASDGLSVTAVNIFSGAETTLPVRRRKSACIFAIMKAVFSETPTSSGCVMAAMTDTCSVVLSTSNGSTTTQLVCGGYRLADITLCNGDLYGLMTDHDAALVKFEIAVNGDGVPVATDTSRLAIRGNELFCLSGDVGPRVRYLVELRGKLLLVVRSSWHIRPRDIYFRVYELVRADDMYYEWTEITSLGDYALFVGSMQCMAARVPASRDGGAKRDQIYFCKKMTGDIPADDTSYLAGSDGHGCRLYCSEDRIDPHPLAHYYPPVNQFLQVDRIESLGYHVQGEAAWILPPNL